jgi:hypothetical protein
MQFVGSPFKLGWAGLGWAGLGWAGMGCAGGLGKRKLPLEWEGLGSEGALPLEWERIGSEEPLRKRFFGSAPARVGTPRKRSRSRGVGH